MAKFVLCGPPRSGKSCLREALKQAIRSLNGPYPYVITACPDGEGAWFQETANADADHARELKTSYKKDVGGFSESFVQRIEKAVQNCPLPMTIVDIGGIPSKENDRICAGATHAILLAGDSKEQSYTERLEEWYDFCDRNDLAIVAEIYSDYHGSEDTVEETEGSVFKGSVHYLERGELSLATRPCIVALAKHLIALVESEKNL